MIGVNGIGQTRQNQRPARRCQVEDFSTTACLTFGARDQHLDLYPVGQFADGAAALSS